MPAPARPRIAFLVLLVAMAAAAPAEPSDIPTTAAEAAGPTRVMVEARRAGFWTDGPARVEISEPPGITTESVSLTVTNRSNREVARVRYSTGMVPDLSSLDRILKYVRRSSDGPSSNSLARSAWSTVRRFRYHWSPPDPYDETHDPVKLLNVYGYGLCDDSALVLGTLWKGLGLNVRMWNLTWHVVPEYGLGGKWHYYDPDTGHYAPDPATGEPLPLAEALRTPERIRRDTARLGDPPPERNAAFIRRLQTTTDTLITPHRDVRGHEIVLDLAPGESMVRYAHSRFGFYGDENSVEPPVYANAVFEWIPDMRSPYWKSLLPAVAPPPRATPGAPSAAGKRTPAPRAAATPGRAAPRAAETSRPTPQPQSAKSPAHSAPWKPQLATTARFPFVLVGGEVEIEYRDTRLRPEPLEVRFSGEGTSWSAGLVRSFWREPDGRRKLRVEIPAFYRGIYRLHAGVANPAGPLDEVEILAFRRRIVTQCSPTTFPSLDPSGATTVATVEANGRVPLEFMYKWSAPAGD